MPIRYSRRNRLDKTRTQRKKIWREARALMVTYPECAYNGDFFCNHLYDPEYPWSWVDFRFFHTTQKRYFAVAMTTCEYTAYERVQSNALDRALEKYPLDGRDWLKKTTEGFYKLQLSDHDTARYALTDTLAEEEAQHLQSVTESITIKDYGNVAVGVWAVVNKRHIDEHTIRQFIEFFRSIGEPTRPGFTWEGKTIEADIKHFFKTKGSTETS